MDAVQGPQPYTLPIIIYHYFPITSIDFANIVHYQKKSGIKLMILHKRLVFTMRKKDGKMKAEDSVQMQNYITEQYIKKENGI